MFIYLSLYMYMLYIHIHAALSLYIYTYIYIERERENEYIGYKVKVYGIRHKAHLFKTWGWPSNYLKEVEVTIPSL